MTSLIDKSTDWPPPNYHKTARLFPQFWWGSPNQWLTWLSMSQELCNDVTNIKVGSDVTVAYDLRGWKPLLCIVARWFTLRNHGSTPWDYVRRLLAILNTWMKSETVGLLLQFIIHSRSRKFGENSSIILHQPCCFSPLQFPFKNRQKPVATSSPKIHTWEMFYGMTAEELVFELTFSDPSVLNLIWGNYFLNQAFVKET